MEFQLGLGALVMLRRHRRSLRFGILNLDLLHHAPVLMVEDVAVQDKRPYKIDEPASNPHIPGCYFSCSKIRF